MKKNTVDQLKEGLTQLKGRDLIEAESRYRTLEPDGGVAVPEMFSKSYAALVTAQALKIQYEDLLDYPAKDFNALVMHTQNFLMQ